MSLFYNIILTRYFLFYEPLGWKTDIAKFDTFDSLPKAAQVYITRIEELVGSKVRWIGTGPDRKDMIEKI